MAEGTAFSITIKAHPHTLHLLNPGNDEANGYTCNSCKFMKVGKRYACKTCTPTYCLDVECATGAPTEVVVIDQQALAAEMVGLVAVNLVATAVTEGAKMVPQEAVEMAVPVLQGAAAIGTLSAALADTSKGGTASAEQIKNRDLAVQKATGDVVQACFGCFTLLSAKKKQA